MKKSLSLVPLLLLAGCGGGGGPKAAPAQGGRATFRVAWPARDARFIPASANSLVVTLSLDGAPLRTETIARPAAGSGTTRTTFTGLEYGNLSVSVKAFPTTDGTGTAQAAGVGTLLVAEGTNNSVDVGLASTVDHLSLSGTTSVLNGGTATLVATAYDASGAMVLLKSDAGGEERLEWSSDDAHATVAGSGASAVVTGAANGPATIKATFHPDGGGPLSATRGVIVSDVFYKPGVVVLPVGGARQVSGTGLRLTITGDVSDIAAGTVLLSSQGQGLTRKVITVRGGGVFDTYNASLEDAILSCDKTISMTMDAAEPATYTSNYAVVNATGAAGDLKMAFKNLDVSQDDTPGLVVNGTFSVKVGVTVHLKVDAGKITRYETTVRDQGAGDVRITPRAAGGYALYGSSSAGLLAGSWAGRSRELLPGVALTPRVDVRLVPGYNERFYNGLSLRLQTSNDATVALRYIDGAWTSDGSQTSNVGASLAPTTFPRNTVHFGAPAPETFVALNGTDSTALDGGVWPSATTSDVAGPPAGVRLVVDATYGAVAHAYYIGFLYNGPLGAAEVTRNFDIQPAASGVVDKTLPKNAGGGDVTIQ